MQKQTSKRDPENSIIDPLPLQTGDTIGVVAPASPQRDDSRLRAGIDWFRQRGFRVVEGESLWNRHGYLAGTDTERVDDLNRMLRDRSVRMIVAGRGGYGSGRILSQIDYEAARENRPIVLGFSDITAINLALLARSGLTSLSGAMPGVDLWKGEENDVFAIRSFERAVRLESEEISAETVGSDLTVLREGAATGRLIPANLTLLTSLCGSPYLPEFEGSILLLEEIGEEVYRLDRLFGQLENVGIFERIAGLALGAFTGTDPRRISVDPLPFSTMLERYVDRLSVPVISGVPYGHIDRKLTLPVGRHATMKAKAGAAEITFAS